MTKNRTSSQGQGKGEMTLLDYNKLVKQVMDAGYAEEIEWASKIQECTNSIDFRDETCWVIINSGMKEQIARKIWNRILNCYYETGAAISTVFRHTGKVAAIEKVFDNHIELFAEWQQAEDRIEFLQTIPFIGKITVWHLAKNLGMDVCKPDRHLVRIADTYGLSPDELCKRIAFETGNRIATVDTVIWRAANLGFI